MDDQSVSLPRKRHAEDIDDATPRKEKRETKILSFEELVCFAFPPFCCAFARSPFLQCFCSFTFRSDLCYPVPLQLELCGCRISRPDTSSIEYLVDDPRKFRRNLERHLTLNCAAQSSFLDGIRNHLDPPDSLHAALRPMTVTSKVRNKQIHALSSVSIYPSPHTTRRLQSQQEIASSALFSTLLHCKKTSQSTSYTEFQSSLNLNRQNLALETARPLPHSLFWVNSDGSIV